MKDIRIPESRWPEFCEDFTRRYHGWLTGIRQLVTRAAESGSAAESLSADLFPGTRPLQELREGTTRDSAELMVTLGKGPDETSFLIEDAVALYSRMRGDVQQGLRVDSGNGTTTLIEFRTVTETATRDG
jgi:hypothetical protein